MVIIGSLRVWKEIEQSLSLSLLFPKSIVSQNNQKKKNSN